MAQLSLTVQIRLLPAKTASADISLKTTALQVNRALDNGFNVGLGVRQSTLGSGTVSTLAGVTYSIDSASASSLIATAAYEMPEIAMRAELIYEGSAKLKFDHTLSANAFGATANGGELTIPQATTLNVQTGIAEGTLLFGSIRNVAWGSSQVAATTTVSALDITSEFENTTSYSLGIGRKLSDSLSGSLSYAQEAGSASTSTSGFTLTNGYNSISAGLKYSLDTIDVSLGYSYVLPGDVTVTHDFSAPDPRAGTSSKTIYKSSTVQAVGLKISTHF
jgi:long-subunit fatty acid transport protein